MPNRIIKESICTSDTVNNLSWFEEVFFYRLIVNCDDYGRFDARPAILRSRLFPLKSVTDNQIESVLKSLQTAGIVFLYKVDGKPYLQLCTWDKHQSVRARKSKYPAYVREETELEINCMQLISDESKCSRNPIQSESNPNTNTNTENARVSAAHFQKPSAEEIRSFCQEQGYDLDADCFYNYYESNGWKVGKNSMKDWKAAVRNWVKREKSEKGKSEPQRRTSYNIEEFEKSGVFDSFSQRQG